MEFMEQRAYMKGNSITLTKKNRDMVLVSVSTSSNGVQNSNFAETQVCLDEKHCLRNEKVLGTSLFKELTKLNEQCMMQNLFHYSEYYSVCLNL